MPPLTGSCLCGIVSVTIPDPAPVMAYGLEICRCTDCRQFTGALAGAFLNAESANVSVEGREYVKAFDVVSEAGNTLTRHWCAECGSSLYDTTSRGGGKTMVVHGGHFPPGSLPAPSIQLWTRSRETWDKPMDGVKTLDTQEEYSDA